MLSPQPLGKAGVYTVHKEDAACRARLPGVPRHVRVWDRLNEENSLPHKLLA